jgi:LysM repeat protein
MQRIAILLVFAALWAAPALPAQDAATEERLNKLSGRIDDLIAAQEALKKQMSELSRELAQELNGVREQAAKPNASYASQEELRRLADSVKEVDRKRMDDYEKIHKEILNLAKVVSQAPPAQKEKPPVKPPKDPESSKKSEDGYEYVIQKDDTLSKIIKACKEDKGIKTTTEQILKANPGLDPKKLKVGTKIFIPAS